MYKTTCKYKPKKRAKKSKFKIAIALFLLLIAGVVLYYFCIISPIICSLSEERIRSLCSVVISQSVERSLEENNITYDDLVHITYNDNKEISLIQSDTVQINKLVRRVTELVQIEMDELGKEGVQIALGTFTGIPFLFGLGPEISLKLVPVGTVTTIFNNTFESAGINQTKHTLNFDITTNVGMILPAQTQNFVTTLEIAICESNIVGKVPEVYLQGGIIAGN